MDVFCPSCLKSMTLEAREPGEYSFECPECAGEAAVTIPKEAGARPIVRPVRGASARAATPPPLVDFDPGPLGESLAQKSAPRPRPSSSSSSSRKAPPRAPVDFPFEESDKSLVEEEPPPVIEADDWESPDFVPQPLRKVKKRPAAAKASSRAEKSRARFRTILKRAAGAAAGWIALLGVGLFLREAAWLAVLIGVVMLGTGRRIVLRAAREEGAMVWIACAIVPFYNVFFSFSNLRKMAPALLLAFCGYAYTFTGFALIEVHKFRDPAPAGGAADEDDAANVIAAAQDALADRFTVVVDGKEIPLEINELTYFPETAETDKAEESFEFFGPDLSLRGTFPKGFQDRWMQLIGRPVPIVAHSKVPEQGDSQIMLSKEETVKVLEGSFTLTDVVKKGQPRVSGSVTLKIARSKEPETIQGEFFVRVKEAH